MGARARAFDWSRTPLGPAADWPQSLKTAVRIMVNSRFPMFVWWGPELIKIYNDAYVPILGKRHPYALGKCAAEVWGDIWPTVGPQSDAVLSRGEATWSKDLLLVMERNGFAEETYFTFSYSPIPADEGGIGGLYCACIEDTARVLSERRLRTLRELARTTNEATGADEACRQAAACLAQNALDLPFVVIYLMEPGAQAMRRAAVAGLPDDSPAAPTHVELHPGQDNESGWPFTQVTSSGRAMTVTDVDCRFGQLFGSTWQEPTRQAVLLPISQGGQKRLAGIVVAGLSPRLEYNEAYQAYTDSLANHVATAVDHAQAYEMEKRRAEALAELDRAKTAFFSNVSHEFRTPLTLLLGPLQDSLAVANEQLQPLQRERLEIAFRNGLRLQRLVNSLLDFSRIEAGRSRATYQQTDLAAFTAELASNFRSACDKAGVELWVACYPLAEPVYIDRQMWEKIVLNLLSNAFKFTFAGQIAVTLRQEGRRVELQVSDTGIGIPASEMPKLFERFHRVENAQGRTHEGSGIGLALVHELVKLHGGTIHAESQPGEGTTFTVSLPLGTDHLPAEHIQASGSVTPPVTEAGAFVEEVLRWLPDPTSEDTSRVTNWLVPSDSLPGAAPAPEGVAPQLRPRVLIADDNADMRQYLVRLLSDAYRVEAVADGVQALAAVQHQPPDLIVSDIMMPRMDGFGLLREIRADPRLAQLPIILLSARAGEESRVEGMQAGADDYLVKPFGARELLARVSAHLQMAQLRREAGETLRQSHDRFEALVNAAPVGIYMVDADLRIRQINTKAQPVFGNLSDLIGRDFVEVIHILWPTDYAEEIIARFRHTLETGESYYVPERIEQRRDLGVTEYYEWQISRITLPDGKYGVVCYFSDISRHVLARQALAESGQRLHESERQLRLVADHAPVMIAHCDCEVRYKFVNKPYAARFGLHPKDIIGKRIPDVLGESTYASIEHHLARALAGESVEFEAEIPHKTGGSQYVRAAYSPEWAQGRVVGLVAAIINVTEHKRAQARERQLAADAATANAKYRAFFDQGPMFAGVMSLDGTLLEANRLSLEACGYTKDQVIGKKFWECPWWSQSRELMDKVRIGSARAAAGEMFRHELPYFVADGTERVVDFVLQPITDEKERVIFLAPTGTDITDRKLADQKLRRGEERMRLLWEAAAVLLTTDDADTMLRQLFGRIASHLKLDAYFNFMINESRTALKLASYLGISDETAQSIGTVEFGQAVCGTAALHRRPLVGSFIQVSDDPVLQLAKSMGMRACVCNPLVAGDQLLGTLTFASRTRDQFADDDLDFLQTICQYVTAAYDRMRLIRQLREADRRKDEFLAILAHELRNPLAPLRNGLQIIRLAEHDEEAVEQARLMMDRQLRQMVHLVDDLLDLSRISRGKIQLRKERIELGKIVQQAVETSRPLLDQGNHELTITVPSTPTYVDADITRLAQVFSNLLNNAAKYTERGGQIRLTVERTEADVVLTVKDNGIGIPAHLLPNVFEMFTQIDGNLERSQGGLGIGLSIVKRLVEMHGGAVEAKSEGHGMGSEFIVRLPLAPSVLPTRSDDGAAPRSTNRCRILVADDNRDAAMSLAMMLKLMGNEAQAAHDGLEAVDVAAKFRPDLVLLDIGMPRLNGYDTARQIRQQSWGKEMVLVALTGWGQEEDRRKSHEAGFDFHLVKPVEFAALNNLLAKLRSDKA